MLLTTLSQYRPLLDGLQKYSEAERQASYRNLCLTDLFFLLWVGLGRRDIERDWLFERCREVQESQNGYLDLWAREHYKSTIITYGLTIQDILRDPEVTVGIFSHTRPIAKGFLRQIKREFEANETLKELFPDILWQDPHKEAPKWSEDDGIIVKRKGNPKESTVESWGLVDGQPTGKHFRLLVYDDVVTRESVTTPEMIQKTTEALELSYNLGADGGIRRFIGTRYHQNDTYRAVIDRGTVKLRRYDGTAANDGDIAAPALWSAEKMAEKRRDMGPYTFACQILQNPMADKTQGFKREWLRWFHNRDGAGMNKFLLCDPASEKKKSSDRTAMAVIGLAQDNNYYLLDLIYDRLNLTERAEALFTLHRTWKPQRVGYEKYGMQADIEHIKFRQGQANYHFDIVELGGRTPKNDRIKRLVPIMESGRFYLPESLFRTDYEARTVDVIEQMLREEFDGFPVGLHDDALDVIARILDEELSAYWPIQDDEPERYKRKRRHGSAWAA
jgi:predicted phage terminase large subunit-like protein